MKRFHNAFPALLPIKNQDIDFTKETKRRYVKIFNPTGERKRNDFHKKNLQLDNQRGNTKRGIRKKNKIKAWTSAVLRCRGSGDGEGKREKVERELIRALKRKWIHEESTTKWNWLESPIHEEWGRARPDPASLAH